jgi:hypothetical protein
MHCYILHHDGVYLVAELDEIERDNTDRAAVIDYFYDAAEYEDEAAAWQHAERLMEGNLDGEIIPIDIEDYEESSVDDDLWDSQDDW